jgi:hypothetical protein
LLEELEEKNKNKNILYYMKSKIKIKSKKMKPLKKRNKRAVKKMLFVPKFNKNKRKKLRLSKFKSLNNRGLKNSDFNINKKYNNIIIDDENEKQNEYPIIQQEIKYDIKPEIQNNNKFGYGKAILSILGAGALGLGLYNHEKSISLLKSGYNKSIDTLKSLFSNKSKNMNPQSVITPVDYLLKSIKPID